MRISRVGAPLNSEPIPALQWIEVASALQIPSFHIVGLPGPEVAEARERVKAALEASGFEFPRRRVVLNLSPASIRKRGTGLDLAMALAILWDMEIGSGAPHDPLRNPGLSPVLSLVAWGELGLDGTVKPAGQLTRTLYACWRDGVTHLLICAEEARAAKERIRWIAESGELLGPPPVLLPVSRLEDAWDTLSRPELLTPPDASTGYFDDFDAPRIPLPDPQEDSEILRSLLPLPPSLERIVGISALGHHHLLLLGPRGTGKSQALEWLIALQPPTSPQARLHGALLSELGGIHGSKTQSPLEHSPVRRVSAQVRPSALLGGASALYIRPGEFSLAHGGLLIADELPEWARDSREALREPLERGRITLTRANGSLELPARFTLAANGNLCPCGGWPPDLPKPVSPDGRRLRIPRCKCSHGMRSAYLSRLSGPVLDRIDLVFVGASGGAFPEASEKDPSRRASELYPRLRDRVRAARDQSVRQWGMPSALLPPAELERILAQEPEWCATLDGTAGPGGVAQQSLRGRHKVLRVALSLAAWDGLDRPEPGHFIEAACYRPERYGLSE